MRPILYRASLSEMVVPSGDTSPTHWNKNVFDMGEVGMGFSANPLTLGCDCLGEIRISSAVLVHKNGWQRWLQHWMNAAMADMSSLTLLKEQRRMDWRVMMEKNTSTMLR